MRSLVGRNEQEEYGSHCRHEKSIRYAAIGSEEQHQVRSEENESVGRDALLCVASMSRRKTGTVNCFPIIARW